MIEHLRVLVVDDHEVVRRGVRLMAESGPAVTVVAEAATGVEAIERCRELRPDVVLMDVDMPDLDGVSAARQLRDDMPEVVVLMLTVHEDEETIVSAVSAGASGYLTKAAGAGELGQALDAVRHGGAYLTPLAASRALRSLSRRSATHARATSVADMTTAREREILELLARGLPAREIARRLGISERTVNAHVGHIYRRLGVRNKVDAIREGMRLGLVEVP